MNDKPSPHKNNKPNKEGFTLRTAILGGTAGVAGASAALAAANKAFKKSIKDFKKKKD